MSPANWCAYGASSVGSGSRASGAMSATSNIKAPKTTPSLGYVQGDPLCRMGSRDRSADSHASISGAMDGSPMLVMSSRKSDRVPCVALSAADAVMAGSNVERLNSATAQAAKRKDHHMGDDVRTRS